MENTKKEVVRVPCIIGAIIMSFMSILLNCIISIMHFRASEDYVMSGIAKYALVGIGIGLVVTIIIFLFTVILTKNKKNKLLLILTTVYLVISIVFLIFFYKNVVKVVKQEKQTITKFKEVTEAVLNQKDISSFKFDKETYGDGASVLEFGKKYYGDIRGKSVVLEKEVEGLKLNEIFGVNSFSNKEKISESKIKVTKAKELLNNYRKDFDKTIEDFKKDSNSEKISKRYRAQFYNGVMSKLPDEKQRVDKYINSISITLDDFQKILEFMEQKQGNYEVKENQVYFYSNSDIDSYNDYIEKLQNHANELERVELEFNNYYREKIKEYSNKLKI